MLGKITLEEAYNHPDYAKSNNDVTSGLFASPQYQPKHARRIIDIKDERIKSMDKYGVGYTVLSLTIPGIQGIHEQSKAESEATRINDWIANEIKDHRDRLGAFACLSMHDAQQAGEELRRCVTKYGFHGALLNDFQHAGQDGSDYLYYDQPAYDEFWKVCCELDVPVYIHPAAPSDVMFEKQYKERKYLIGPPLSFANGVSLHLLGMICNGVFDRFPKLKIIVGHLGEHLPFDFWRINHWFEDIEKPLGMVAKKTLAEYFNENIWVTTSGHFSSATLNYCIDQLGADRIMFSIDSPYETYHDGCTWYDDHTQLSLGDRIKIGITNAKALLKIGNYKDQDAPVTK